MPPRTAFGFKIHPWVESNHALLWISLHIFNSRKHPAAGILHQKIATRLVYICNKHRRTMPIHYNFIDYG